MIRLKVKKLTFSDIDYNTFKTFIRLIRFLVIFRITLNVHH